jgi:hypothetical protein
MRICSSKCEPSSGFKVESSKDKGKRPRVKGKIGFYRSGSDLTVFLESFGIRDIPVIEV